jgi:hypothetical protein
VSRKWIEFGLALRLPGGPIHQRRRELIRALQLGKEFGGIRSRGKLAGDPDGPWQDILRERWIRWKYDDDRGWLQPKTRRRVETGYVKVEVPLAGARRLFGLGGSGEARETAPLPDESVRSRGRLPASSPAAQPAPAPVDEQPDHDARSSRRRGDNGHAQPARDIARIVLRRLFPNGLYPTKGQLSNRNLLKRVDKSWDANEGEANGKLTKASPDYIKKPSHDTFLREVGRKD